MGERLDDYEPLVEVIAERTGTTFRAASAASLSSLRDLKVPEPILRFYARFEPADCAESPEGAVRLWPIRDVVVENTQGVPGVCVLPFGSIVFASTMGGDAYCFNLNRLDGSGQPEVVLISHGSVGEDSKAEEVHPMAKTVARTLHEFLTQFSRDEVDQQCIVPPSFCFACGSYLSNNPFRCSACGAVSPLVARSSE